RGRVDEAWILPNSFRSALLPFLARVPERIGYATDGRAGLLTHRLPRPPATRHQLRDYDALLASRGIAPDLHPPPLPIPPRPPAAPADPGRRRRQGAARARRSRSARGWAARPPLARRRLRLDEAVALRALRRARRSDRRTRLPLRRLGRPRRRAPGRGDLAC